MTISATTQGIKPGVCLSTNKPAAPFDGQVIYMTDVDQTAVWDGTQWTVLAPIASGRNVVINGAMQVAQRGTSVAGMTTGGYNTVDRFNTSITTIGTWTESQEADYPSGSGFVRCIKLLCTTADASPAAGDIFQFRQLLEGQNLQQFAKGTASAKSFALSFWVKSNVTGTYIVELRDNDNTRAVSASYTISASATWEKKTITFPADTTGLFDNDSNRSLDVIWGLAAGSTYTSGTLQTTWASITNANRYVGQTNVAAAVNNYWQVTGVQLEAGAVATPFEFEDFGVTLDKCQRYYQKSWAYATAPLTAPTVVGLQFGGSYTATPQGHSFGQITFVKPFRANPTVTIYSYVSATAGVVSNATGTDLAANSGIAQFISEKSANVYNASGGTITPATGGFVWHYVASIEL